MSKTEEFLDWLKLKAEKIPEITEKIFETGKGLTEEEETI